jgi:putative transposase
MAREHYRSRRTKKACDSRLPRFDELSSERVEEIAIRHRLVSLLMQGLTPRKALERLDLDRSERWARKLRQRYEKHGGAGLMDGRWANEKEADVLTREVKDVILKWWHGRRAAGPKAVWEMVSAECRKENLPVPGYEIVKKYLASLPLPFHWAREGKIKMWDKQGRPVVRVDRSTTANERFQIDHTRLDIWVREWTGAAWVPAQVWLTLALDEFTRSVAGLVLSTKQPDAWTTPLLVMNAVLPKKRSGWKNMGLPQAIQPDRGKDFMANANQAAFAALGIGFIPDPAYYPNEKGKVERWFDSLDRGCLRKWPGHMDAIGLTAGSAARRIEELLTRNQLKEEIERWIVEDYHVRTHTETGRRPGEHWEEIVRVRMPEDEEVFAVALMPADKTRVVRNTGIKFQGRHYWAPELTEWFRHEVTIRYHPEEPASILVYSAATGERICEAWLMGQRDSRYKLADVKAERTTYRRGLQARAKQYREEVEELDRRAARRQMEEAARLAEEIEEMEADDGTREVEEAGEDVRRLMEELEREERGEK